MEAVRGPLDERDLGRVGGNSRLLDAAGGPADAEPRRAAPGRQDDVEAAVGMGEVARPAASQEARR